MLPSSPPDHRSSSNARLADALRGHDALALAEAYHRTVSAAHACARRMLASPGEVEALLLTVYGDLWEHPPEDVMLEGWVRRHTFHLAFESLRRASRAPASASAAALLPQLPGPSRRSSDLVEQALVRLDDVERRTLLLAHDHGVPSRDQGEPRAEAALRRGLVALAEPERAVAAAGAGRAGGAGGIPGCDRPELADWVLGLVSPAEAGRIEEALAADGSCAELVRILRRGRRRLEGLPPTPDMGHRIIAAVLSGSRAVPQRPPVAPTAPPEPVPPPAAPVDEEPPAAESAPEPGSVTDPATVRLSDLLTEDELDSEAPDVRTVEPPRRDPADRERQPAEGSPGWYRDELGEVDRDDGVVSPVDPDDRVDDQLFGSDDYYDDDRPAGSRLGLVVAFVLLAALGAVAGFVLWPMLAELLQ